MFLFASNGFLLVVAKIVVAMHFLKLTWIIFVKCTFEFYAFWMRWSTDTMGSIYCNLWLFLIMTWYICHDSWLLLLILLEECDLWLSLLQCDKSTYSGVNILIVRVCRGECERDEMNVRNGCLGWVIGCDDEEGEIEQRHYGLVGEMRCLCVRDWDVHGSKQKLEEGEEFWFCEVLWLCPR